ncbi:MAG TPA: hypothetical protein VKV17_11250 [Bryobacteraceae bacterium]|nr:hypothetical protein [Bryobacteraceae bacterium]
MQAGEPERNLSGNETILVAEDDDGVRRFVRQVLGPIHLLFSDVVMPEMGGIELARRLAEARPSIAVLWVAGLIEHLLDLTAPRVAFAHKPFSAIGILREIRKLLVAKETHASNRWNSPGALRVSPLFSMKLALSTGELRR